MRKRWPLIVSAVLYYVVVGVLAFVRPDSIRFGFLAEVWPNLIATLLAVPLATFAGVLGALYVNGAQEREARREEEISLWRAAYQAVLDNVLLCQQIEEMTGEGEKEQSVLALTFPTFGMDPTVLNYVAPRLLQMSKDQKLAQRVNNFRYQVAAHLDPKLNLLREWIPRGDASARATEGEKLIRDLYQSIYNHAGTLVGDARLADDIEDRIKRLERS